MPPLPRILGETAGEAGPQKDGAASGTVLPASESDGVSSAVVTEEEFVPATWDTASKIPVNITGISAPENRYYNGRPIENSDFGTPVITPEWSGELEYVYYEGNGYEGQTQLTFTIARMHVSVRADNRYNRLWPVRWVIQWRTGQLVRSQTRTIGGRTFTINENGELS